MNEKMMKYFCVRRKGTKILQGLVFKVVSDVHFVIQNLYIEDNGLNFLCLSGWFLSSLVVLMD